MARARNIKPAIMDNEELASLPALHRLLFIYLWMLADREGRLEDRPKRIAVQALGYDRDADVESMLADLERSGFIERYEACGVSCILIVNFLRHQSPHGTEKDSVLPSKDGAKTVHKRGKNGYITTEKQDENSVLTVKEQSNNTLIPDSGFLIPDSLSTDSQEVKAPRKRAAPSPTQKKPHDVAEQTWQDWLALRKAKRAPVTATVVEGARREAEKAAMSLEAFLQVWCRRGSQGLEAAWLRPDERGGYAPVNKQQALEQRNREVAAAWLPPELRAQQSGGV